MAENAILIASPVNKHLAILQPFLDALQRLETGDCPVAYCFVDDNDEPDASKQLQYFVDTVPGAALLPLEGIYKNTDREKADHRWNAAKIDKIIYIKNSIIQHFLSKSYSHLFFVDADLVLHPQTLQTLLASDKDIVANIFWTKWQKDSVALPQVWLKDFYSLYDAHMLYPRTKAQIAAETEAFLNRLRMPGIYKVGGLGACTLIRRKVLEAGVNFSPLYNLSFWGEDRSFCIRAVAMGFALYVNTIYPAFHLYRMEDLQNLPEWQQRYGLSSAKP